MARCKTVCFLCTFGLLFSVSASSFLVDAPTDSLGNLGKNLHPSSAPSSLHSLPASPIYPLLPGGGAPQPEMNISPLCNLELSSMTPILDLTAGDCRVPLGLYVGNVICCPQLESMLHILGGEHSYQLGSFVWNGTGASKCFADIMDFLIENGSNSTVIEHCHVRETNLTGGSCPVTDIQNFEELVDINRLLAACSSVDPLKECCKASCQPVITDAAVRLATASNDLNQSNRHPNLQQTVDDCTSVIFSWLARRLGPQVSNTVFRILLSCKVNQACPLVFEDVIVVANVCTGSAPSESDCCGALATYISSLQRQMLITNIQALECVTSLGSMLQKNGVTTNIYRLCSIDLKDFSLQVHGEQGCLLRSMPTDIVYDNVSGISFTCDLNDNILAPWPATSSLSSFPLCAGHETLPALPVLDTSGDNGHAKARWLQYSSYFLVFCVGSIIYDIPVSILFSTAAYSSQQRRMKPKFVNLM